MQATPPNSTQVVGVEDVHEEEFFTCVNLAELHFSPSSTEDWIPQLVDARVVGRRYIHVAGDLL